LSGEPTVVFELRWNVMFPRWTPWVLRQPRANRFSGFEPPRNEDRKKSGRRGTGGRKGVDIEMAKWDAWAGPDDCVCRPTRWAAEDLRQKLSHGNSSRKHRGKVTPFGQDFLVSSQETRAHETRVSPIRSPGRSGAHAQNHLRLRWLLIESRTLLSNPLQRSHSRAGQIPRSAIRLTPLP
jgi:hypothetical protein